MLKPNADKPAAKPGPKPDANDDLKSLPMPEVEKKLRYVAGGPQLRPRRRNG